MFRRAALIVSLSLLPLAGCTKSFLLERPDDQRADTQVTGLWAHEIRTVARHGDVLLSRSYSFNGDIIALLTRGEDLSHAALYDAERDLVIESIDSGVREIPLQRFLHRNHHVLLLRPAVSAERRAWAVQRARDKVGAGFDFTGLVGIDDPDRFYCTELVAWALAVPRSGVVVPSDMFAYGAVVYVSGSRDATPVLAAAAENARSSAVTLAASLDAHGPQSE